MKTIGELAWMLQREIEVREELLANKLVGKVYPSMITQEIQNLKAAQEALYGKK